MTLQNGLVHGQSVYAWTDTAWWSPKGEIVAYASKAFQMLHWPAVGILSVHGENPHSIASDIGLAFPKDVPELLAVTVDALRAFCLRGGSGRVLLATNQDGPRLHIIASDGAGLAAPFEPVELLSLTSSGNQTAAYLDAVKRGFTPERMRHVIEAQIAEPVETVLGWSGRNIGGNVVEFEVSAEGVDSRVLRSVGKTTLSANREAA